MGEDNRGNDLSNVIRIDDQRVREHLGIGAVTFQSTRDWVHRHAAPSECFIRKPRLMEETSFGASNKVK